MDALAHGHVTLLTGTPALWVAADLVTAALTGGRWLQSYACPRSGVLHLDLGVPPDRELLSLAAGRGLAPADFDGYQELRRGPREPGGVAAGAPAWWEHLLRLAPVLRLGPRLWVLHPWPLPDVEADWDSARSLAAAADLALWLVDPRPAAEQERPAGLRHLDCQAEPTADHYCLKGPDGLNCRFRLVLSQPDRPGGIGKASLVAVSGPSPDETPPPPAAAHPRHSRKAEGPAPRGPAYGDDPDFADAEEPWAPEPQPWGAEPAAWDPPAELGPGGRRILDCLLEAGVNQPPDAELADDLAEALRQRGNKYSLEQWLRKHGHSLGAKKLEHWLDLLEKGGVVGSTPAGSSVFYHWEGDL